MSTPHVLLGLLAAGPRHGYELKRAHDERLPHARPLAFGQVYSTLGRLERDGFVRPAGHDQNGGPERTAFEITESGRDELTGWLEGFEAPAPYVNSALLARVVVALLLADTGRAHAYLESQRRAHSGRLRELTALKTGADATLSSTIAIDFAIVHLDADLRWLQTTLDRVAALRGEFR